MLGQTIQLGMFFRRRRIAASLLLLAGLATLSEAAFHDGIIGSSLRYTNKWNRFEQQQSRNLQTLVEAASAQEACEASRSKEEADIAPGGGVSVCTCQQFTLDERQVVDLSNQPVVWELSCVDRRCDYCSPDGSTCDRFSYGALFEEVKVRRGEELEDGVAQVAYFESNQYVVGRPEVVTYTEYSDPANPGSHACSMAIDGLECAVCEYVDCLGSEEKTRDVGDISIYYGLNVVCSNIVIDDGNGEYIEAADFQTCDTDFIASLGQGQSVFEMYDPEYGKCFTSVEACARDQLKLEQSGYYKCDCVDGPEPGVSPFLENVMLECHLAQSISLEDDLCNTLQQDTVQRTFSSYAEETNTRTIQLGSGSTVVLKEFDCLTTKGMVDGCHQCKALVDGTECSSCEMIECDGSNAGHLAASIACGNVLEELGTTTVNLCDPESSKGTPFEAFSVCGFGEHSEIPKHHGPQSISMMACHQRLREFSQSAGNVVDHKLLSCQCLSVDNDPGMDAGTLLECRSSDATCGSVCNAEYNEAATENEGLCFREELVEGFLSNGSSTPITRTTTYTHGTDNDGYSLVGSTLVLTEFGNGSKGCELMVDGDKCNSCRLEDCGGNIGIRPLVDCSNIDASLNLNTCEAVASYQDGLLMRFTAGASDSATQDFSVCRDESSGNFDIDKEPFLPNSCGRAMTIALPTREDDPSLVVKDILNPNSMFAFVSFVASTKGLSLGNNELSSVQETCETDPEGYANSPGLWYSLVGRGKGVHASVCREATDFDARISVYQGSCDGMKCVTTTPLKSAVHSPCDVHWVAEEGLMYYIRVHGTDETQTGTFNLFLETLDNDVTSTCYSVETGDFDKACLSCNKAQTMRIQQFENDPAEIDCQCIYNPGTGGYHLTCADMSCLKCNGRQDLCGFNTVEQDIQLSGESPFGSYESFYYTDKADGAQAIEIVDIQNSECLEIHDPYQQCLVAKAEVMAREEAELEEFPFFCECRQTSPKGHHMLICSLFDAFEFCVDNEDDMCVNQLLFGQSISHYGTVTSEFRNFRIELEKGGFKEEKSIMIERLSDTCYASINGESCSSCELVQSCVNNGQELDVLDIASTGIDENVFTDMSVDCSNLVENGFFECGRTEETNLLSVLSGKVSEKESYSITSLENQIIPPNAFPPTMAPVSRPTSPPVDPPTWPDNTILIDVPIVEEESSAQGLQTMACVTFTIAFASVVLLL